MQPTSRKIDLATGLSYHLLEWDGASDHTVVLVHGFADMAWSWQAVADAGLAGKLHLVAPDMRGHGDSDRVGRGGYYHFMDYLADLHDLVHQVGRGRVSLVGHSMGGSICAYYAGSFPERIHRLALLEGLGPPEGHMNMPRRVRTWLDSWKRIREEPVKRYASIGEAAEQLRKHDRLLTADVARNLAERSTVAGAGGGRHFKHDPLHVTPGPYPYRVDVAASFWREITCPVLHITGSESLFRHRDEEAERRMSHFANIRTATIDGAGHMMIRHRPREVASLLVQFLG